MKRFVKDDDGHWYLIPHNKTRAFEHWVYSEVDYTVKYEGEDFEEYRCHHPSSYVVEILNNDS